VQRLYPDPGAFDLERLYTGLTLPPRGPTRPWWVAMCMVASVDGAASAGGLSADLGGEADRLALERLRGAGDVVLVGAATVRWEGYGPLVGTAERREDRVGRGLAAVPRLVVLTSSGDLDPASAPFTHPAQRPLVLTGTDAVAGVRRRLGDVADVAAVGNREVDMTAALVHLAGLGLTRVVCEGGPRVNRQLLADGLVDEVFVTVAPVTVAGDAPRIAHGPGPEHVEGLRLESVWHHDGDLLLRYRRPRTPPVDPASA
jgi:riboflavin biosynthesis pyrimidine reductase